MKVRILIVDDHAETRSAVRRLLEAHSAWEICAEAANGLEAVHKAASLHPDLVVLDFSMPRMSGLQAARAIHEASPNILLLLFSIHGADPNMISQFQSAGFRGTVPQNTAWLLPEAIESLLQGKTFFPPYPSGVQGQPADNVAIPTNGPLSAPQPVSEILAAAAPAAEPAPQAVSISAAESSSASAPATDPEPNAPGNGPTAMS